MCQSVHRKATAGASRTVASNIPTFARGLALQPKAAKIRKFTDASSKKSARSANSDTDWIESATTNSIPK